MQHIPQTHEIYRHFKGNFYEIISLAEHSETGETLVVYQAMYGEFKVYARPLAMFLEKTDKEKYPDAKQDSRFELQEKPHSISEPVMQEKVQVEESFHAGAEAKEEGNAEEINLDPLVLEFLDAGTYEEKLNILTALHHRITDDMINVMAMASDIEIKRGELQERFDELKNCLLKLDKYESSRLR